MLDFYYKNIEAAIDYGHSVSSGPYPQDFHLHDRFEIYLFISGSVNYFIEKKVYPLKFGDLLVMNSHEIHKPSIIPDEPYERIVIHFDPAVPHLFSSPECDLLHCFVNRPIGGQNKISLSRIQTDEIMRLFLRLENMEKSPVGSDAVLKLTFFIELLVYINAVFMENSKQTVDIAHTEDHFKVSEKLAHILDYLDRNLEGDLTLETLERVFYLDKCYLSRLFKKGTGSNIHEYIIYKRISRARKLLAEGYGVTEACILSGFNDYTNFLRMFKKTVGVPPGQYKKSNYLHNR